MGVDVNLYVIPGPDDDIPAGIDYYSARAQHAEFVDADDEPLTTSEWRPGRLEAQIPSRFWGPGYERGNWPVIAHAIEALRHAFPHGTVHYGGDESDDAPEVTDELMAECWAHWWGPQWDAYRAERLAASAASRLRP